MTNRWFFGLRSAEDYGDIEQVDITDKSSLLSAFEARDVLLMFGMWDDRYMNLEIDDEYRFRLCGTRLKEFLATKNNDL